MTSEPGPIGQEERESGTLEEHIDAGLLVPACWTLMAYVHNQHPRYSKRHLMPVDGFRTLCGILPPIATHHHHNDSGRCLRCWGSDV